jgi:hypothetical protein
MLNIIPYASKHCLRRYLTLQIIPQTLPKKVLGSIGIIYIYIYVIIDYLYIYIHVKYHNIYIIKLCICNARRAERRAAFQAAWRPQEDAHLIEALAKSAKSQAWRSRWM